MTTPVDQASFAQLVQRFNDLLDRQGASTGGGLTSPGALALDAAVAADGGPTNQMLGLTSGGILKRFTTNLFAARRTKDLDVLPGSEYAEWISCLTSTGLERKIALTALTRTVGEVIDPSLPPYNVKFDYQKTKPVAGTSGSNRLTTADPVFLPSDRGKQVAASNLGSQGTLVGYIGVVEDSRNVRIFTDLTFSSPANCASTFAYAEMIWGTDNTAGMQAALDAAEPRSTDGFSLGRVVLLTGVACVRYLQFGSIAICGLARTTCGLAAFPSEVTYAPVLCDKQDGAYARFKPANYTLREFSVFGQHYTQGPGSYRNNIEVRGGDFFAFQAGDPGGVFDGVNSWESQIDGFRLNGAFAGQFNNIGAYSSGNCGIRIGFWDLNGQNWHAEANSGPGVLSYMPGANVSMVRTSFNGSGGANINLAGRTWGDQMGCNWCELGYGNTVTNIRMQESWSHSLVLADKDPLGYPVGANKNTFVFGTFDDTGDMVPAQNQGGPLPTVRAMVLLSGDGVTNNTIETIKGAGQVKGTNYATNAVAIRGYSSGNTITMTTPGIGNDNASWYAGGGGNPNDTVAAAPGLFIADSQTGSAQAHGNIISVNKQLMP